MGMGMPWLTCWLTRQRCGSASNWPLNSTSRRLNSPDQGGAPAPRGGNVPEAHRQGDNPPGWSPGGAGPALSGAAGDHRIHRPSRPRPDCGTGEPFPAGGWVPVAAWGYGARKSAKQPGNRGLGPQRRMAAPAALSAQRLERATREWRMSPTWIYKGVGSCPGWIRRSPPRQRDGPGRCSAPQSH